MFDRSKQKQMLLLYPFGCSYSRSKHPKKNNNCIPKNNRVSLFANRQNLLYIKDEHNARKSQSHRYKWEKLFI